MHQVIDFFGHLFGTESWPARWNCGKWSDFHGWLYICSDLAIWAAYFVIPFLLINFLKNKRGVPLSGIFWLFGAFILFCGLTHLVDAAMFWWPAYRVNALVRFITAFVSWVTVVVVIRLFPKAKALRTAEEFEAEISKSKKAETKFKALLESGPDAIVIMNKEGIIELINLQTERIFGYRREEIIGRKAEMLMPERFAGMHPLHRDGYFSSFSRHAMNSEPELYAKKKNGAEFPVEISFSPLESEELVSVSIRDITEKKKAQEALLQEKEKGERSEKIEQFLANMSHEIRTPMNAIIGFTDLLEKTEMKDHQHQYLRAIKTSGENLLTIINDILDYSKIEQGAVELEKITMCVWQMLDSLSILMNAKAKEKALFLDFKADETLPDAVIGDPTRLTQIILNLVGNAIKFTEQGGVMVNAKMKEETADSVFIEFQVSDTGIGIPAHKLQTIFERFQQADSDTTRNYGGTGLGLAIVKSLVELQGGTISLTSEEGKGSVFTFVIPYQKASAEELKSYKRKKRRSTLKMKDKKLGNLKVLLAEDNKINQILMSVVLSDFGFETEFADNGKIALEKIQKKKYDFILMDMQMPVMDGYQTTMHIREELKINIPIIAMTAHALKGEKEKCLKLGMNDYISKPFNANKLYHIIGSLFQNKIPEGEDFYDDEKRGIAKDAEIIDISYLEELSDNDMTFVKEMLEMFIKEVPDDISRIREAIEKGGYTVIKNISHKLKSSIHAFGMGDDLDKFLSSIEDKAASKSDMDEIKELFSSFARIGLYAVSKAKEELAKLT